MLSIDHVALTARTPDAPPSAALPPVVLAGMIGNLLGREAVHCDDDIFVLGFHSVLAMQLVAQIVETFGVKLPLRALFENPTAAMLARRLTHTTPAAPPPPSLQPIVTINVEGARTPFAFFHHDFWAAGTYCRRLAEIVGPAQPFFALAPHGSAGLPVLATIEAMARDYLDRLRAVQPHGPYRLGGSGAGGLLAYELARLLQARGELVEPLILIDPPAPRERTLMLGDLLIGRIARNARLEPLARGRLCRRIVAASDALAHGPAALLRLTGRRVRDLVWGSATAARRSRDELHLVGKQRGSSETEHFFAYAVAAHTYRPEPYDGELIVIASADSMTAAHESVLRWERLVHSVRIMPIPDARLPFTPDGVENVGRILATILRSAVG